MSKILQELIDKQLKDVTKKFRFTQKHLLRLSLSLPTSIFHPTQCSIWSTSYISRARIRIRRHQKYVTFSMRGKKHMSQRLIYLNYCGQLPNHFIRSNCSNKGKCCNINHMTKVQYRSKVKVKAIRTTNKISKFKYHGTIKKLNLPKVKFTTFYLNFD